MPPQKRQISVLRTKLFTRHYFAIFTQIKIIIIFWRNFLREYRTWICTSAKKFEFFYHLEICFWKWGRCPMFIYAFSSYGMQKVELNEIQARTLSFASLLLATRRLGSNHYWRSSPSTSRLLHLPHIEMRRMHSRYIFFNLITTCWFSMKPTFLFYHIWSLASDLGIYSNLSNSSNGSVNLTADAFATFTCTSSEVKQSPPQF